MKSKNVLIFICVIVCNLVGCADINSEKNKYSKSSDDVSDKGTSNTQKNLNVVKSAAAVIQIPITSETVTKESALNSKTRSFSELRNSLKNIPNEDVSSAEEIEKIKHRFKKYHEIKEELSELNLFPRSDSEIMKELINNFKNTKNDDEILIIMEDFDYLVHQYDNAQEFVNLNGFQDIIYSSLNSTNPKIRAEALKLLGSAVQHNAKVQIHALETDAVNILLKILAIDADYSVKMRTVFALSSLLRRFPLAQYKFIENAGLKVFSNLFDKPEDIKIQLKVTTLLTDLLLEHNHVFNDSTTANYSEKIKQYNQINLKQRLKQDNWCQKVENLLKNVILVDGTDHDSIQRCLELMNSISDICISNYSEKLLNLLQSLKEIYENLISSEQNDETGVEYFIGMRNLCDAILNNFKVKLPKIEL